MEKGFFLLAYTGPLLGKGPAPDPFKCTFMCYLKPTLTVIHIGHTGKKIEGEIAKTMYLQ